MIKKLFNIFKFLSTHPLTTENKLSAFKRFIKWQVSSSIIRYPVIIPFVGNTKLIMEKGMHSITGNYYVGLMEYESMMFLLHVLRPKDYFIDIGANAGVYTILASGVKKSNTLSIEPIPSTFNYLKENVYLNQINNKVNCLNIGIGSESSWLNFTENQGTTNHVISNSKKNNSIQVKVDKLDNIINKKIPLLIKIDIEGYEMEMLNGAHNILENNDLSAIIIETNGSGKRYGYSDQDIDNKLKSYGFIPYKYNADIRKLIKMNNFSNGNSIYIRNLNLIRDRLKNSKNIQSLIKI